MTPSIADLKAFVAVADAKSFATASKALFLSQPALSRRISHLEEVLGVRLFDRTTRTVELTNLGSRFLAEVRGVLDGLDRSLERLSDLSKMAMGEIRIGCVFSAVHQFLPEIVNIFNSRFPKIMIRIMEGGAEDVLTRLKQGDVDFALNYIGMHDPDVDFTPLLSERFVLACSAMHPLAAEQSVDWMVLKEYPYAVVSHSSRNRVLIDQAIVENNIPALPIFEVEHVSTLIGMVNTGNLVAVVPQLTLPRDKSTVVGIPLDNPKISRTIGIAQRAGRSLSPAASAFFNLLLENK